MSVSNTERNAACDRRQQGRANASRAKDLDHCPSPFSIFGIATTLRRIRKSKSGETDGE
ncbi:hypothetical protein [Sphingomonas rhizophila]|uniref:hypothetical protein n=1 Tax=Sphingomonas rhizophila TaxID=2071607 RepID=UPI001FE9DA94|nr:hypothetical protein [Sphingomonas rhizophila]